MYENTFENGVSLREYKIEGGDTSDVYVRSYLLKFLNPPFTIDLQKNYG